MFRVLVISQLAHCATRPTRAWLADGPLATQAVGLCILRGGQSATASADDRGELLYAAVVQGDVELLRELLAGGASPDWTDAR